jgi:hypothetical protein
MRHLLKLAKPAAIFFVFTMLLSLSFPFVGFSAEEASALQPYLAEMAAASPDETIRVIVMKADNTDLAEKFAERLGAEIYVDLPIINGFAMAIEGKMLELFASHASVQWVSYDAPMTFSGASEPVEAKAVEESDWLCDFFGIGCDPTPTPTPTDPPPDPTPTATDPPPDPSGDDCWFDSSFTQRRKITFDNSASATDLHNFPVLIKLNSSNINYAGTQNDGRDIRFVDGADCTRLLGYEIEKWNEYGDSFVWVNVPKIDAGSTSDYIYIYYKNSSATDAQNPAAVWSETYAAVYHLNGDATDSSGNGHHGTVHGSAAPGAGAIAGGYHIGSTGYIETNHAESYGKDAFSLEVFWRTSGFGGTKYIISSSKEETQDKYIGITVGGVAHAVEGNPTDRDSQEDTWTYVSEMNTNQWYYTVFYRPPGDSLARAPFQGFLDGVKWGEDAVTGFFDMGAYEYMIGKRDGLNGSYNFGGDVDEVRISYRGIIRTEDYIEAQNLSMTDQFLTVGVKEIYDGSQPTPEAPEDPTPTPTDPPPPSDPPADVPSENTYLNTIHLVSGSGSGVVIAVVDSGVQYDNDFKGGWFQPDRITAHISGVVGEEGLYFSPNNDQCADYQMGSCWYVTDQYGHGTHVAGIIAGDGRDSLNYMFKGIAPQAQVINFRVADQNGMAHESGIVEALQYIMELKETHGYNIRVLNISINSTLEASYNESPLNAALEILWFNGIAVVASAGNTAGTINAAPANDPYVITVGAVDEHGTADRSDDTIPTWSSHGVTLDGVAKPDVYAPGRHIISVLSSKSPWATEHPDRVYGDGQYFRMSGTSMAAPMVAGTIAHIISVSHNYISPDQFKYMLMNDPQAQISSNGQSGGYLDASEIGDESSDWGYANQDNIPHLLLRQTAYYASSTAALIAYYANYMCGVPVEQCDMSSVNWNSVDWNSVNWNSVDWNSVNWNSVNWNSVNWNSVDWNSVNWNSVNWNSVNWNSVNWNSVDWNSVNWNSVNWNSVDWNSVNWNSVNWNSVNWNSVNWNSNASWDTAVNWNSVNWNSVNWNSTFWGD